MYSASAPKGIPIGIFRAVPTLTLTSEYNQNVDAVETGTTSDQILTTKAGVELSTRWRRNTFTGKLSSSVARHKNTPATNDYENYSASVKVNMKPRRRLTFDADYTYSTQHDDQTDTDSGAYANHSITTSASYRFKKFSANVDTTYTHKLSEAAADREVDPVSKGITVGFAFPITPKTNFDVNAGWKTQGYDRRAQRDNDEYMAGIGMSWKATAKTTGDFIIGATSKKYGDNGEAEDKVAITMSSNISWEPSRKTSANLTLSRDFNEGGTTDIYSIGSTGTISVNHSFRSYLNTTGSLTYTHTAYATTRKDEQWATTLGLQYKFPRWLSLGVDWSRTMRDSNTTGSSYANNTYSVSLTGGL